MEPSRMKVHGVCTSSLTHGWRPRQTHIETYIETLKPKGCIHQVVPTHTKSLPLHRELQIRGLQRHGLSRPFQQRSRVIYAHYWSQCTQGIILPWRGITGEMWRKQ